MGTCGASGFMLVGRMVWGINLYFLSFFSLSNYPNALGFG